MLQCQGGVERGAAAAATGAADKIRAGITDSTGLRLHGKLMGIAYWDGDSCDCRDHWPTGYSCSMLLINFVINKWWI